MTGKHCLQCGNEIEPENTGTICWRCVLGVVARGSLPIYKYKDVDNDKLAVFPADIPGQGRGVNILTDRAGCSLPDADIPTLIIALQHYVDTGRAT